MPHIAIIGAGIAGLNAALTLQDAGLSCEIYEASDRVGGRMHSNMTSLAEGLVSEYCGEFIDGDHKTMRQLARRFGLKLINLGHGRKDRTQSILYMCDHFYGAQEFTHDFQALAPTLRQQLQQVGTSTTYQYHTEAGYRFDQMSIYDWIEQYVEGGHHSPLGRLLDHACTGFYGLDSRQQSALSLIYMFGPEAQEKDDTTIEGPLEGSSKIAGGNEQLPQAIAHSLPAESLHLHHQLLAIKRSSNDAVMLSFATPADPLEVQCEHVILALPFSTLRRVDYRQAGFDALKETAITQLGYGTISKLALQFDTPYWFQQGPWPLTNNGFIFTDLDIQTFWDASPARMGTPGLLINYRGGHYGATLSASPYATSADSQKVQHYALQCLQQLEQVFPGISPHYTGTAVLSYPTGDPFLLGSYSCLLVGQYTHFFGYEGVRQGPIHFAGEHCSVEWPGYMEGAAIEGARAAKEIIQDYR